MRIAQALRNAHGKNAKLIWIGVTNLSKWRDVEPQALKILADSYSKALLTTTGLTTNKKRKQSILQLARKQHGHNSLLLCMVLAWGTSAKFAARSCCVSRVFLYECDVTS
eukprot:2912863-Pleurochrysis_carterae.AAC.1